MAAPSAPRKTKRQPWNTSTRLSNPVRRVNVDDGHVDAKSGGEPTRRPCVHARDAVSAAPAAAEEVSMPVSTITAPAPAPAEGRDERAETRAMIERAVSLAFGDALADSSAFQDTSSPPKGKENEQPQQRRSAPVSLEEIEAKLQAAVDESDELRAAQRHRRQRRAIDIVKSQAAVKHKHEFHRRLAAATVEYRQRKLAIQALVERIEREMQYLRATAADLGERECLLDDAFANYEDLLRVEFGMESDAGDQAPYEEEI